jgi:UrcA family protein
MTRILIAAAAALLSSTTASANGSIIVDGGPSTRVSYGDLNLRSRAGQAQLSGRIRSAADFLCSDHNIEPLELKLQRLQCYRIAVASGTAQMNAIAGR